MLIVSVLIAASDIVLGHSADKAEGKPKRQRFQDTEQDGDEEPSDNSQLPVSFSLDAVRHETEGSCPAAKVPQVEATPDHAVETPPTNLPGRVGFAVRIRES